MVASISQFFVALLACHITLAVGQLSNPISGLINSLFSDVILPPPAGKIGPVALLLFAQGAQIPTSQYSPLLQQLQEAVPFPLWVGIPQCAFDVCAIPGTLASGMARIKSTMASKGMTSIQRIYFAGHSLGGAMLPDFVASATEKADGMVLLGSFIPRSFKTCKTPAGRPQVAFSVPSLTIGAELDGLCRITRIVEALYSQVIFSASPIDAKQYMGVTIIPGMNHMQFATGNPPLFVAQNDLKSAISLEDAHAQVVSDFANFLISKTTGDTNAIAALVSRVDESIAFAKPITDAFLMEGYFNYLPPCMCETKDEYGYSEFGTCASTPACNGGCPWTTKYAHNIMAGTQQALATVRGLRGNAAAAAFVINNTDSIHIVSEERPSCHLPHIHKSQSKANTPNWANPGSTTAGKNSWNPPAPPLCTSPAGCQLTLTSVTQPTYDVPPGQVDLWKIHFSVPISDTGFLPISASELKTKLKSRESIWQAAGVKNVSSTVTDIKSNPCGEINQAAINWALKKLSPDQLARYQQYGQKLQVGSDVLTICPAGPCWIYDPLKMKANSTSNTVTVQSVYMYASNNNPFPCGEGKLLPCPAGFHYCKLLSPARALEWMLVDGLKKLMPISTSSTNQ